MTVAKAVPVAAPGWPPQRLPASALPVVPSVSGTAPAHEREGGPIRYHRREMVPPGEPASMRRVDPSIILSAVILAVSTATFAAAASPAPGIDLTALDALVESSRLPDGDLPLEEVRIGGGASQRRVYISGMIGPSFAAVSSPGDQSLTSTGTIFTAGAALGIALDRSHGSLRLEVEGMGRDVYDARFSSYPNIDIATTLTNNWSVLQNVWRDVMLTERLGVYGGGGIGAGGFILGERYLDERIDAPAGSAFAWQVGGGIVYDLTDRLAFDVGYRYLQIGNVSTSDTLPIDFTDNELMFMLRLYEPFRRWTR